MNTSVFKGTMAEMSYPQIEAALQQQAVVLLPVSVIEEHGPHLCTGTDMYLTGVVCRKIRDELQQQGKSTVIAPPFYWGINSITDGFTGSFSIRKETAQALLKEIIENLDSWGFQHIFLVSFHGDFRHMRMLAETVIELHSKSSPVAYLADQSIFQQLGYAPLPDCLISVSLSPDTIAIETSCIDIHAGAMETSWMALQYEQLVDMECAKALQPTQLKLCDMKQWIQGGSSAKQLTLLGYCGNPANIQLDKIQQVEQEVIRAYTDQILMNLMKAAAAA